MSTFIAKWNDCGKLRRFRVSSPSEAELYDSLLGKMAAVAPHFNPHNVQLTYTDSEGDQIVFSSSWELADAVTCLGPRQALRISTPETDGLRDQREGETPGQAPVADSARTPHNTGNVNQGKAVGAGQGKRVDGRRQPVNGGQQQRLQARNAHLCQQVGRLRAKLNEEQQKKKQAPSEDVDKAVEIEPIPVAANKPINHQNSLLAHNANLRQQVQRLRARLQGGTTTPQQMRKAGDVAATRQPTGTTPNAQQPKPHNANLPNQVKPVRVQVVRLPPATRVMQDGGPKVVKMVARPVSAPPTPNIPKEAAAPASPQNLLQARNVKLRQQVQRLRAQLMGKPADGVVIQRRAPKKADVAPSVQGNKQSPNPLQARNALLRQQIQRLRAQLMGGNRVAPASTPTQTNTNASQNPLQVQNANLRKQVQRLRCQLGLPVKCVERGQKTVSDDGKPRMGGANKTQAQTKGAPKANIPTQTAQNPLQARNANLRKQVQQLRAQLGLPVNRPEHGRKAVSGNEAQGKGPRVEAKRQAATDGEAKGNTKSLNPNNLLQTRNDNLRKQVQKLRAELGLPVQGGKMGAATARPNKIGAENAQQRLRAHNQRMRQQVERLRERLEQKATLKKNPGTVRPKNQAEKAGAVERPQPKQLLNPMRTQNERLHQQVERLRAKLAEKQGQSGKRAGAMVKEMKSNGQPAVVVTRQKPQAQDIRAQNQQLRQQVQKLRAKLEPAAAVGAGGKHVATPKLQRDGPNAAQKQQQMRARNVNLKEQLQQLRTQLGPNRRLMVMRAPPMPKDDGQKKEQSLDRPNSAVPNNNIRTQNAKLTERIGRLQAKLHDAKTNKKANASSAGDWEVVAEPEPEPAEC